MTTFPPYNLRPTRRVTNNSKVRRILIECTHTLGSDLNTGIQRVVRNVIGEAWSLQRELKVHCVPVAIQDGRFHDVGQAWCQRYGTMNENTVDSRIGGPIQFTSQDLLLLLDSSWHLPAWRAVAEAVERGCTVGCVYYDLIPVDYPEFCDENLTRLFQEWLNQAIQHVDFAVAISQTVSRSIQNHARTDVQTGANRMREFDYFRLGADFSRQTPSGDIRQSLRDVFENGDDSSAPYLTVGTIEPRKNHSYLLDAFDVVWDRSPLAKLCIVGRIGWKVDELVNRIQRHPQYGKSLFMFNDLNDVELQWCYQRTKAFVFPSIVEGFGLPIVEALHHGLRVMASDTPIHREVGKDFCAYFDLQQPESLARMIVDLERTGDFPSVRESTGYEFTTWQESSRELLTKCLKHANVVIQQRKEAGIVYSMPAAPLLERLDLQPAEPLPPIVRHRHLSRYHDRRFVEMAYLALLKRPMDPSGDCHVERLRRGVSKADVLRAIKQSEEGRRSGAKVQGLSVRHVRRRLERIPVLGYIVNWLVCLATLPRQRKRQEQSMQYVMSLLTRLEDHLNGNYQRLEAALACLDDEGQRAAHPESLETVELDATEEDREFSDRGRADAVQVDYEIDDQVRTNAA